MNVLSIAGAYALIGILGTAVNLACQALTYAVGGPSTPLLLAIGVGTAAGLPVKYVLEKRYVFQFVCDGLLHDGKTFMVYSVLGAGTTLIFWSIEFGFDLFFRSEVMRYVGGALGLSIGYTLKYHLDKTYVFCRKQPVDVRPA
jgi:putative flippase GtrA